MDIPFEPTSISGLRKYRVILRPSEHSEGETEANLRAKNKLDLKIQLLESNVLFYLKTIEVYVKSKEDRRKLSTVFHKNYKKPRLIPKKEIA